MFGGTTGNAAQEIWACTLKLVYTNAGPPVTVASKADALTALNGLERADLLTAADGPVGDAVKGLCDNLLGQAFALNYVKLNAYGENDMQVTDPTVDSQFTPMYGTISVGSPWSTALDFYHRSSLASRGFASHGRIGFPTEFQIDPNTGKINALGTTHPLSYAVSAYQAFLPAVADGSPFSRWYPGILYTSTDSAKPPQARIIDRFIASDIPGEVRTRQNALNQGSALNTVAY